MILDGGLFGLLCHVVFNCEDGGSMFSRIIDIEPGDYMSQCPV
jgi:hypothetical protein